LRVEFIDELVEWQYDGIAELCGGLIEQCALIAGNAAICSGRGKIGLVDAIDVSAHRTLIGDQSASV
jgi:hypothetical protein